MSETTSSPTATGSLDALPAFLTPEEVAHVLRLPLASVRDLLRRGEIPGASRVGRLWRVRKDVLLARFESTFAPTTAATPDDEMEPVIVTSPPRFGRAGRPARARRRSVRTEAQV